MIAMGRVDFSTSEFTNSFLIFFSASNLEELRVKTSDFSISTLRDVTGYLPNYRFWIRRENIYVEAFSSKRNFIRVHSHFLSEREVNNLKRTILEDDKS